MKTTIPLVLLGSLLLSGCVVGSRPASPLLANPLPQCSVSESAPPQGCITQCRDPLNESCPIKPVPSDVHEIKVTAESEQEQPQLGLALSGGGSKVAPFAIGVLKRFVDNEWIFKTQYLTSVSGGSYAAFYLYYRAYRAIMVENELADPGSPRITPPEVPVQYDPLWPGLTRYFADAREVADKNATRPYLAVHSSDFMRNGPPTPYGLASRMKGCLSFTTRDANASPEDLPIIWKGQNQELYQGWVECYQDMLMTHPAREGSSVNESQLAEDFELMFLESIAAAPAHYFANILFDWKKSLSPTQFDYLYGIERTYAFFPMPGEMLPRHLHDEVFQQMANCLDFRDIAQIYLSDPARIDYAIGGILPKWVIESTGTNGNVGLNLSPRHYDLSQDVFEISFDEYGSGRFGYVKGAPSVIGLTVPYAVLASAAFADTAQRNLTIPRGVVDLAIQGVNVKWGIDVANYNVSNAHRILHSFLVWPFYYLDDPMTPYMEIAAHAPTIHLSDGGQSGDNLGLIAMFRRGVKNIVVAAGEDDFHNSKDDPDGWLDLGSLCAANYYLIQRGFTLVFESDPRHAGPATKEKPFNLKDFCRWDGNRQVYIHPGDTPPGHITPFNWVRRVWVGQIKKYDQPTLPADPARYKELPQPQEDWTPQEEIPPNLENIKVFYLNAALDRSSWVALSTDWYPGEQTVLNFTPFPQYRFNLPDGPGQRTSTGANWAVTQTWYPAPAPLATLLPQREWLCEGELAVMENNASSTVRLTPYSCPLLAYIYDINDEVVHSSTHWRFPQTSTFFTTYDNNMDLFRAYRDLGWEYAGALADLDDPDLKAALKRKKNEVSATFRHDYPSATTAYRDPDVCKGWVGPGDPADRAEKHVSTATQ